MAIEVIDPERLRRARELPSRSFQKPEKIGSVIVKLPAGRAEVLPITGGARVHGGQQHSK
jgi:hypothetical protein